jgi:hypothetical protein
MRKKLATLAIVMTSLAALAGQVAAQTNPGDPEYKCLQHPVTGECAPTWIHNCWC